MNKPKQETHIRVVPTKRGKRAVRVNPGFHKHPNAQNMLKKAINQTGQENTAENKKALITLKNKAKSSDEWAKLVIAAITFPNVTFKGQEGAYPRRLADQIPIARLMQLAKDPKDFKENATPEECLAYLSTMSLVAPLDRDAEELMTYLLNKTMKEVPEDLKFKGELSYMAKNLYDKLKRDIRKTQWSVQK